MGGRFWTPALSLILPYLVVIKLVSNSLSPFVCFWWRIWFRRNNVVHGKGLLPDNEVGEWVGSYAKDFR